MISAEQAKENVKKCPKYFLTHRTLFDGGRKPTTEESLYGINKMIEYASCFGYTHTDIMSYHLPAEEEISKVLSTLRLKGFNLELICSGHWKVSW